MTLEHANMLEKLNNIFVLREEQSVGGALDGDVKEVVERVEVSHHKLQAEACSDAM
jgi:hypothetical protein